MTHNTHNIYAFEFISFIGLPYRGSKEALSDLGIDENTCCVNQNEGVFLGLVKLLNSENEELKDHLIYSQNYSYNGQRVGRGDHLTFLSPNFVGCVLEILKQTIVTSVVCDINNSNDGYYAIEADNSQDITQ